MDDDNDTARFLHGLKAVVSLGIMMKFGPVTFNEILVKNDDGSIETWSSNHPTITIGRVKILGMESYWIPLDEARKAVAKHGLELVIKGNKVIGTRKMTARGD